MSQEEPRGRGRRGSLARWQPSSQQAILVFLSLLVCILVTRVAWVSEDSFITLRYVSNTHAGLGPVFNPGESVQGYTHPLWFGFLVVGHWLIADLVYLSIALGILFTALTVMAAGNGLFACAPTFGHGVALAALFAVLCVSSNSWVSFQTSGLENSLAHFILALLVVEVFHHELDRIFLVTALGSLLVLTRPDLAFVFFPITLLLLPRLASPRAVRAILLGALPLVGWLVFALGYYGGIVPNSATAKIGVFSSWQASVSQGITYLLDWTTQEPFSAISALILLVIATLRSRTITKRALAAGIWMQLAYVVWVGGDFMRGRFLLSVFVASLTFGLLTLADALRSRSIPAWWSAALLVAGLVAFPFARSTEAVDRSRIPPSGIVNERLYYPGYQLSFYTRKGRLESPYLRLSLANQLRDYALACGAVTVHARNPGTLGFLAGPQVSVIDVLGLTDAFVAALPKEALIQTPPRVGHPDKFIPLRYLSSRRDIAILEGWATAVADKDCSFPSHTEAYLDSDEVWAPWKLFPIETTP